MTENLHYQLIHEKAKEERVAAIDFHHKETYDQKIRAHQILYGHDLLGSFLRW